jgi:hypothetical protein
MPALLAGRDLDDVSRPDLLDRVSPTLDPAHARGDDRRLSEWMRVPHGAGARLEGDRRTERPRRARSLEERIDPNRTGEIAAAPRLEGRVPLRVTVIFSSAPASAAPSAKIATAVIVVRVMPHLPMVDCSDRATAAPKATPLSARARPGRPDGTEVADEVLISLHPAAPQE